MNNNTEELEISTSNNKMSPEAFQSLKHKEEMKRGSIDGPHEIRL